MNELLLVFDTELWEPVLTSVQFMNGLDSSPFINWTLVRTGSHSSSLDAFVLS